jgi:tetratricopeptide (TPR) repeat protein
MNMYWGKFMIALWEASSSRKQIFRGCLLAFSILIPFLAGLSVAKAKPPIGAYITKSGDYEIAPSAASYSSEKPHQPKKTVATTLFSLENKLGSQASWYQLTEENPLVKGYFLPFFKNWMPSLFKLSQAKLNRLLTVFGYFFLSAAVFALYQSNKRRILKRSPSEIGTLDKESDVKPIEKIGALYESSLKAFLIFFAGALMYSLMIQSAYGNRAAPIQLLLMLALVGGVIGRRMRVGASFLFSLFLIAASLFIFDLKAKISVPVRNDDSMIGFFALLPVVALVSGIWSLFTKDKGRKKLLEFAFLIAAGFILLVIHIADYQALGIPVIFAISLIWWAFWRARTRKRILSKIWLWLGMAYARLEEINKLEQIGKKLDGLKGLKPIETAWIRAKIANARGDLSTAIDILAALEPSEKTDQLLFELYQKKRDFSALEARAAKHAPEQAVAMLRKLPKIPERDGIILNLFIDSEAWDEIRQLTERMYRPTAISRLEKLPQTVRRDLLLLPLLYRENRSEDIYRLLDAYSADEGVEKLTSLLSASPERDQLVIGFLARRGNWQQVREHLSACPPKTAISYLKNLPESDERDRLLAEYWIKGNEQDALLEYFQNKPLDFCVKILEKTAPGLIRDRTLAKIHAKHQRHSEIVEYLEKYLKPDQLGKDDLHLLAESYSRLHQPENAVSALEKAWALDPQDEETLQALSRESIALDKVSQFLSGLDDEMLQALSADALWALIEYFRHFEQTEMTRKVADISIERWKDHRAIFFLAKHLEDENEHQKAADIYSMAGKKGVLPQALCLFKIEDYHAVVPLLRQAEMTDENRAIAMYHLGFALYKTGQLEAAYTTFDSLDPQGTDQALQADITRICMQLGYTAMKSRAFNDAIAYLESGLQHSPPGAETEASKIKEALAVCYHNLALESTVAKADNADTVNGYIEKARSYRNGPWEELDLLRGLNHLKEGDYERAMQTFSVLSKRSPENRQHLFHKALAAALDGRSDYAQNILSQLTNTSKNDPYRIRTRLLLGAIALRMGNGKEAEDQIRLALADI